MTRMRKTFSNEFKARVALEAIKGYKTISELTNKYYERILTVIIKT